MNKSSDNIYKNARIRAGLRREPVAEELNIDVRTLDKYESLTGHPPDDIVRNMCILYKDKILAWEHIKKSPLAEFFPSFEKTSLQGATLLM